MMANSLQIPANTIEQQRASSNPQTSSWVSANAGSGKTHVLTQRVIRLMLDGNAPDRILCLTFTKAAAANMKNRVFETLAGWTLLDDRELREKIRDFTGNEVSPKQMRRARSLFAEALDTPGGLKIQTIHAFCESLLHQFPLEANVPGHFETLQEAGQAELLELARSQVMSGSGNSAHLIERFRNLNHQVSADAIDRGLSALVSKRNAFLDWINHDPTAAMAPFYDELGLVWEEDEEGLKNRLLNETVIDQAALKSLAGVCLEAGGKNNLQLCRLIHAYQSGDDVDARLAGLMGIGLTKSYTLRSAKTWPTKAVKDVLPEAEELIIRCGEAALAIREKLNSYKLLKLSEDLYHIAYAVLERFESMKRSRGAIDFDDQVEKAAKLLIRSDIRDWIRYRLDRGIDHLLVDEAQDTSPKQWSIINAVTEDFHSGETAAQRDRTVFVVGDEKQSIYSFQGADPKEFSIQERQLRSALKGAGKPFHPGKLNLSFRSTADVLRAVDAVFESEDTRRGLSQSGESPVHDAVRRNDPGEVQIWPVFAPSGKQESEDWLAPVDQQSDDDPVVELSTRIAAAIGEWVGKSLPGSEAPLRYKDILVLVRKRDRFITALTRTMKDAGLAVAGADRIVLTDHIAVEDLLALGQFVLLPQDDLTLACVLKSPLFGVSEEALFDLCFERDGTLFDQLNTAAQDMSHPQHELSGKVLPRLEELIARSKQADVFGFFAWVLGPFGARQAILSRLGTEAEDVLDAFLEETIAFSREGGIGLENFLSRLAVSKPEIKREVELDRDEVRILTAHASKGLEARVVFLVDPCTPAWTEKHRPPILDVAIGKAKGLLWQPSQEFEIADTRKSVENLAMAAEEEYRRLLYVGMTRAADRLILCGYRGSREPKERHWHSMVSDALLESSETQFDENGDVRSHIWRISKEPLPETASAEISRSEFNEKTSEPPPGWLFTRVKQEAPLPRPLTPSGAHALIDDEEIPLGQNEPSGLNSSFALQRGIAIHKMLEQLPDIDSEQREEVALQWLSKFGADWRESQRQDIWADVQNVLTDKSVANLFASPSRAEVPVVGNIKTSQGMRAVSGQIDRLIMGEGEITVLDYKTSRVIPGGIDQLPPVYVTQLALYREIIMQIYPDKPVKAAILWTESPQLMFIPDHMMDEAIVKISN